MACGLRRCSGKRGCICPKASRSSFAFAGAMIASSPDSAPRLVATEEDGGAEATPEDVTRLFTFFDLDGNGMIDRKELADVLSSLDGSYWTMKRIRALFRAADLNRDQSISWVEFCKWVFAPGEEQRVLRSSLPALEAKKAAEQAAAEAKRQAEQAAAEAEKAAIRELRSQHEAALVASESVPTLAAALESAEAALAPYFGEDELQKHRQRLERMKLPFEIVVMTIAGGEFRVEVTRQQSVASLCQELARLMGKKAYRILLAHEAGRLEPPTATLEACGVKVPMQIAAQFGEADPLLELPLADFMALLVEHDIATQKEIEALQQECSDGKTSDEDVRCKFKSKLSAAITAAEVRREREELERRRKAEEEEKQRKALEARRTAMVDPHRAELGLLPFDVLLEQAVKAQIVEDGEAVPEERRDSLLQQLALVGAKEACEAEKVALDLQIRDERCEYDVLVAEAMEIKDSAQSMLDECLPQLDSAYKELKKLRKQDIDEIRCFRNPPSQLRKVLEAVCILHGLKPIKKKDPSTGMIDDYWEVVQREFIAKPGKFLESLFEYDKDNIPETTIMRVKPYIEDETCDVANMTKINRLGVPLCLWVPAMYKYHFTSKEVEPHRLALRQKEMELEVASVKIRDHHQKQEQLNVDLEYFLRELKVARSKE